MPAPDLASLAGALRANTTDGAAVLARQAIGLLRDYVSLAPNRGLRAATADCAHLLAEARPDMAAVGNLVRCWQDSFAWPRKDFRVAVLVHCNAVLDRVDRALEEAVGNARRRLAGIPANSEILTHSASSTVRATVADLPIRLLVTASEPGGEGRHFAAELGARCIEDRDGPAAAADAAAVVVGADAVGAEAFVNKVGTRALADAAQRSGTPFFVVAESYKWLPPGQSLIAGGPFEAVPNALVTDFLLRRDAWRLLPPRLGPWPGTRAPRPASALYRPRMLGEGVCYGDAIPARAAQMAFSLSTAPLRRPLPALISSPSSKCRSDSESYAGHSGKPSTLGSPVAANCTQ